MRSENNYRTARINETAALIYHINSTLPHKKTGTSDESSSKFRLVPLPEQMSNQFIENLRQLAQLAG